jgi:hypothetical protein
LLFERGLLRSASSSLFGKVLESLRISGSALSFLFQHVLVPAKFVLDGTQA